jgi:futalosine hydrolase
MDHSTSSGSHLVVIPSEIELQHVRRQLDSICSRTNLSYCLCGIGFIDSLVAVGQLLNSNRPSQLWLLGIAGSFLDRLQVGHAYEFARVSCYGLGVGCNEGYQSSQELGWPTSDRIVLERTPRPTTPEHPTLSIPELELLSVTAASANSQEAQLKLRKFPAAAAEDMEAFAVASLCRASCVPLRVIRGISNRVGDRNSDWQVGPAMQAAVSMLEQLLEVQA